MWWYSTVYILQVKSHIPVHVHVVPLRFTCKIVQDTLYILYLQDRWVGTCINNMDIHRLRNGYKAEFCNGWYTVNIFCVYDNWWKIVF